MIFCVEIKSNNIERFERLKKFVLEILPLLDQLKIKPILWGSFAYICYSKDFEMSVNDIDFLISKENYESLLKKLNEENIKYNYVEGWDCIQIIKEDIMIEFDPLEEYPIDKFEEIDLGDFKLKAISLEDLKRRYKLASEDKKVAAYSTEKVRSYRKKYEKLQALSK